MKIKIADTFFDSLERMTSSDMTFQDSSVTFGYSVKTYGTTLGIMVIVQFCLGSKLRLMIWLGELKKMELRMR